MNAAKPASERTSATTSANVHANDAQLTEEQFLDQQADLALEALANTWGRLKSDVGKGVSPIEWTRQYPWTALTAASVAGFVVATQVVPSKDEQALKKLAALREAAGETEPTDGKPDNPPGPSQHRVLFGLLSAALKAVQPLIISAITAKLAAQPPENGQEPAAPDAPPGEASSPS